ncbi:zinc finger CDGSH domain-containing protein 1 [Culex quinquefasciatus]|uniref:Zinc finger CDGSH domain-containing protein 1 n=1 Tax=Culex quinquefasciatus TaxID=7176 RepID=B0WWX0_CULQU|nr:zinc finger CDGSH domain-containing protein 1 [Culex quinquefasciatus]|eukprot:XP_001861892.1 zinc finger CDGSH domain-containing protein 1 [Culex quinquefasciatus]
METLSGLVKTTLPNYLSGLPIPNTFGLAVARPTDRRPRRLVYMSYLAFCPEARPKPSIKVNRTIRPAEAKVVDMIDIEDIGEKAAFCRCWKSKNWPYCDGSHGPHNKECQDNLGPVVVQRKKN